MFRKTLQVALFTYAMGQAPRLARDIHILRMAVRAAILSQFGLEYVENSGLFSICIAGFTHCKAAGNVPPYQPHPSLGREIDSCNTPVAVFIGVRKTENPVDAHRADNPPELRSRDDE
jgi:hypothetical protein